MTICGLNTANSFEVGFLYLSENGPFTAPALEFSKATFKTTQLSKSDIKSATLRNFGVVWWHDGDDDPGPLSTGELDVFIDYAESGGALLLTGKAFSYVTPMGLEAAQPRAFGPKLDDGSRVGIIVINETLELGLVEGLQNIDGKDPTVDDWIQINSTGFPISGDYFDLWKNFTTLAHAWEGDINYLDRIAAFGYWKSGNGKVFNMNWRLPNFHSNNESIDHLEQLTENVINWLASESEYSDVSASSRLPVLWGQLKDQR